MRVSDVFKIIQLSKIRKTGCSKIIFMIEDLSQILIKKHRFERQLPLFAAAVF